MHCRLSYIISTRNRLPFLSVTLPLLMGARQADEEIIVVDGASTDGTVDYVRNLQERGDIDVFVSEPDRGEAHGLNKGCLLARGDLIKVVSDDDAFDFGAIRMCREYMLDHPEVDLMAGNVGDMAAESPADASVMWSYANEHRSFRQGATGRFFFNGLPIMLRRTSIPLLGLFATGVIAVDLEYSLRTTATACIGWCDSVIALRIDHGKSNFRTMRKRCDEERRRLAAWYDWKPPPFPRTPLATRWRRRLHHPVRTGRQVTTRLNDWLSRRQEGGGTQHARTSSAAATASPQDLLSMAKDRLDEWNRQMPVAMRLSRAGASTRRPRVAMLPVPSITDVQTRDDPHLQLLAQAIEAEGWDVIAVPFRRHQLDFRALQALEPDVLHLHYPQRLLRFSAADILLSLRASGPLPRHAQRPIDALAEVFRRLEIPIVWQIHDLITQRSRLRSLDESLQRMVYAHCDGLILHEESCFAAITDFFGAAKPFVVSRLGDYSFEYGRACERQEARLRLGLGARSLVFAHVSTPQHQSDPTEILKAFRRQALGDAVILLAGQGMTGFARTGDGGRVVEYGRTTPSCMRDVFCAADFVVDSADQRMTSRIVRTAMSYSRPVLARAYGATIDMARGAAITIDDDPGGVDRAMIKACALTSDERRLLERAAAQRSRERSWRDVGRSCVRFYDDLRASQDTRTQAPNLCS